MVIFALLEIVILLKLSTFFLFCFFISVANYLNYFHTKNWNGIPKIDKIPIF